MRLVFRLAALSFFITTIAACSSLRVATFRGPSDIRSSSDYSSKSSGQRYPSNIEEFRLDWPLETFRMTRGFSPYRKNHYGIDLARPKGTAIKAAHDGKVIYVGNSYRGFGKLVILEHPNGWGSMYAHCNDILVREGDWISMGEKIATVGRTGNARGVHLHFELRRNKKAVDPLLYLPKR